MNAQANDPAFPIVSSTGDPRDGVYCANGLTKREYFAAKAMQGLLADPSISEITGIAETAVTLADMLIAALEERK